MNRAAQNLGFGYWAVRFSVCYCLRAIAAWMKTHLYIAENTSILRPYDWGDAVPSISRNWVCVCPSATVSLVAQTGGRFLVCSVALARFVVAWCMENSNTLQSVSTMDHWTLARECRGRDAVDSQSDARFDGVIFGIVCAGLSSTDKKTNGLSLEVEFCWAWRCGPSILRYCCFSFR